MDLENQIKKILAEVSLYQSQGLLAEAKQGYLRLKELVNANEQLKNREGLLDKISERLRLVEDELAEIENPQENPRVSEEHQDVIKSLFSFSKEKGAEDLEGAIALMNFGQFDRALVEFKRLIKGGSRRLDVAENILKCHMALSSLSDAVEQYKEWLSSDTFSQEEMESVGSLFEKILAQNGVNETLFQLTSQPEGTDPQAAEDELLRFSFAEIRLKIDSGQERTIDIDVSRQRGNAVTLSIPKAEKDLIRHLQPGHLIGHVRLFSPAALFNGSATVSSRNQISSGPRQGYYDIDIRVQST
jgi:tetratricopeptide (TPR) repeat protein